MKKIYLLIVMLFLLSGCSVDYNLEFNDNLLTENIKIGQIDYNQEYEINYLTPYAIYNNEVQELYILDYSNRYLNLRYSYSTNEFETSQPFNECYELSNISYDDKYYYILTSNEFKCLNYANYSANEVKIKFTTNHKVIETNADYIDNNTYIWVINNSNNQNKPIKIKVEKNNNNTGNEKPTTKENNTILWIILGIIIIIITLIGLHIKRKIEMSKL